MSFYSRVTQPQSPELGHEHTSSSDSFRARLRSQEPDEKPQRPSSPTADQRRELYRQLCASLSVTSSSSTGQPAASDKPDDNDPGLARLKGLALHSAAIDQLMQAHVDVESEIAAFAEESSKVLAKTDSLYKNIHYPLCATLCSSAEIPSASVATHLTHLYEDLKGACLESEQKIWAVLADQDQDALDQAAEAAHHSQLDAFKKEAQKLAEEKLRLLDQIQADCQKRVQLEGQKMIQNMLEE
ncbi:hypothetical protein HJFPF1_04502 [Paramyrothecium foliicola]|nr:hypothetical protein HJFPF1_04502 [Paramyrothecium foliicola]